MAQIPNPQTLCPDFSPAFEAKPIVAKSVGAVPRRTRDAISPVAVQHSAL